MGRRYQGHASGQLVRGIFEPVTTNFVAHPAADAMIAPAPKGATLVWNSATGSYESK
jgi:hypothetical protein